jgi:hypothetical protein
VYQERSVVDGWGLAHSLLADCCDDILGAASSDASSAAAAERDAWTLVASLAANPARDNCLGARMTLLLHCSGVDVHIAQGSCTCSRRQQCPSRWGCCCIRRPLRSPWRGRCYNDALLTCQAGRNEHLHDMRC